ncbi:MAG: hypothetical protein HKN12_04395, partial [Gemmatimonadetes bacterium]|nr:hypothetical protein [Gemmatimonadota bacterium]
MATSSERKPAPEGRRIRLVRLVLPAALLLGALLRAEYLRELISTPFWYNLLLDAEWYDEIARRFADGRTLDREQLLFRAPLYPLFLSSLYRWFGPNLLAPRVLQMALGLILVVVTWRIAFRTHGRRVAALTAVLAATYGMFIYYEAELLGASVTTLLAALALLSLLEGDAQDSLRRLFFAGLALGLATATHALALVMAPVAALWILRGGRRVLPIAAFLIGLAIPVGGVVARNYATTGTAVIAAQGGINFYIGNNARADGRS